MSIVDRLSQTAAEFCQLVSCRRLLDNLEFNLGLINMGFSFRRFFCEYRSVRKVRVPNRILVGIYWGSILAVFLYVLIYTVLDEKGYQRFDHAVGATATKVKGTASSSVGIDTANDGYFNKTVFDAVDLVLPSSEIDSLFITTGYVDTPGQTRGLCDGNNDIDDCTSDDDCEQDTYTWNAQGILTGTCGGNGKCQVYGWCPLENDTNVHALYNVGKFTIFVRNDIRFPEFQVSRTNTKIRNGRDYLEFGYNLFVLDDLVSEATDGKYDVADLATEGAVLLFESNWECDLDESGDACDLEFAVSRLDNQTNTVTSGFNFRTVFYEANTTVRTMKKLYGIRIVFFTSGTAGEFNFAVLTVTIGAGLAYVAIASLLTDIVLENFLPESVVFSKAKTATLNMQVIQSLGTGKVTQVKPTEAAQIDVNPVRVIDNDDDHVDDLLIQQEQHISEAHSHPLETKRDDE